MPAPYHHNLAVLLYQEGLQEHMIKQGIQAENGSFLYLKDLSATIVTKICLSKKLFLKKITTLTNLMIFRKLILQCRNKNCAFNEVMFHSTYIEAETLLPMQSLQCVW